MVSFRLDNLGNVLTSFSTIRVAATSDFCNGLRIIYLFKQKLFKLLPWIEFLGLGWNFEQTICVLILLFVVDGWLRLGNNSNLIFFNILKTRKLTLQLLAKFQPVSRLTFSEADLINSLDSSCTSSFYSFFYSIFVSSIASFFSTSSPESAYSCFASLMLTQQPIMNLVFNFTSSTT